MGDNWKALVTTGLMTGATWEPLAEIGRFPGGKCPDAGSMASLSDAGDGSGERSDSGGGFQSQQWPKRSSASRAQEKPQPLLSARCIGSRPSLS